MKLTKQEALKKIDELQDYVKDLKKETPQGVKIVNRWDSSKVIFQSTKDTIKKAVEEAASKGANLRSANLEGANLEGCKTVFCKINFGSDEYEQAKQFIEGLKL